MGNLLTFKTKKPKRSSVASEERVSDNNDLTVSSEYEYDQMMIKKLIKEFTKSTDIFILNHIVMSVMFLEDYDRDFATYKNNESNVSPTLLKEYQKGCLQLDIIPDIITEYIKFKPHHGRKKDISESLLTKRIYVMYDNFEIITEEDEDYCGIDKPRYRAKLVDTSKSGYVRLKYVPENKSRSSTESSDSDDSSKSSEHQRSEDEAYSRVNDLRTLKDLNMYDFCDSIPFPENFIQKVTIRNEDEDFFRRESYLNSEVIMKHFQSKTVQQSLLKSLEFKEEDIDKAQCTNSSIFIANVKNDCFVSWEVVPAVNIPWPASQASEWYYRSDRNIINSSYKWPSSRMMDVVTKLDCAVIPRGYMPKRGENKKQHLEWEISFPRVEKYLESKLKHGHIKPYLVIAALFKTFIEPKTEKKGVLMEHFRNHLYWQVESNVLDWYEDVMGKKILKVLKSFYEKLSTGTHPDYFIRDKNVFENIPSPLLRTAQDTIHEIMESPVMFFIGALRNVHYIKSDFYPEPDFKKLCTILTESALKTTNPQISNNRNLNVSDRRSFNKERVGKKKFKKKGEKKKVVFKEKEAPAIEEKVEKKISQDSLDFEWTSHQIEEDDILFRERLILTYFLDHFIEITKSCIRLKVIKQAKFYVKRCYYLLKMLIQILEIEDDEIKRYDKEIKRLQKEIHINNVSPPEPPARNSLYVPKVVPERVPLRSESGSSRVSLRPSAEAGPSNVTLRSKSEAVIARGSLRPTSEAGISLETDVPQRPKSLNLDDKEVKTSAKTFIELNLSE